MATQKPKPLVRVMRASAVPLTASTTIYNSGNISSKNDGIEGVAKAYAGELRQTQPEGLWLRRDGQRQRVDHQSRWYY